VFVAHKLVEQGPNPLVNVVDDWSHFIDGAS
jgi:hypothetical protein